MKLFTAAQQQQLLTNGHPDNQGKDHLPVVKLFAPNADATWLITEIDPDDQNTAFSLCDLGHGLLECVYIDLPEIIALRGRLGLPVERDQSFEATHPISVYEAAAVLAEQIMTDGDLLNAAAAALAALKKLQ